MRIEAGKHPAARYATIYLNGEKVTRLCKWADAETGEVALYKTDALGNPIVVDDAFVLETLRGEVRIELPDEHKHLLNWKLAEEPA